MKSYENDKKGLSYVKYPNSGLGAFLDKRVTARICYLIENIFPLEIHPD